MRTTKRTVSWPADASGGLTDRDLRAYWQGYADAREDLAGDLTEWVRLRQAERDASGDDTAEVRSLSLFRADQRGGRRTGA